MNNKPGDGSRQPSKEPSPRPSSSPSSKMPPSTFPGANNNSSKPMKETEIEAILARHQQKDNPPVYLVKLPKIAYKNCIWLQEAELQRIGNGPQLLIKFLKESGSTNTPKPYYNPSYDVPERILDSNNRMYLVKWRELEHDQATWEQASALHGTNLIHEFEHPIFPTPQPIQSLSFIRLSVHRSGVLPHQVQSASFLYRHFLEKQNVLVFNRDTLDDSYATECSVFLSHLLVTHNIHGPFLVISNKITLWRARLRSNIPGSVLEYVGTPMSRIIMKKLDFFYHATRIVRPSIVLTTPELLNEDPDFFGAITWKVAILDDIEAQKQWSYFFSLSAFQHILINQPINTMTHENLWSLYRFVNVESFKLATEFFESLGPQVKGIDYTMDLLISIMPYSLIKYPSENFIDDYLFEYDIPCPMTSVQQENYQKVILDKYERPNLKLYDAITVASHPYLVTRSEAQILNEIMSASKPIEAISGKFKILSNIMETHSRLVIMSHLKECISLISSHFHDQQKNFYLIDVTVRGRDRSEIVNKFNKGIVNILILALYTPITDLKLQKVTTVIIFDSPNTVISDYNNLRSLLEQNSTPSVTIYRLLTEYSAEFATFNKYRLNTNIKFADHITDDVTLGRIASLIFQARPQQTRELGFSDLMSSSPFVTIPKDPQRPNLLVMVSDTDAVRKPMPSALNSTSISKLTKYDFNNVIKHLFNFGIPRWNKIAEVLNMKVSKVIAPCLAIFDWLAEVENVQIRIPELYRFCREIQEFKKLNSEYRESIIGGSNWKIQRLEQLFVLNVLMDLFENPDDDFILPPITPSSRPARWWTDSSDRQLLCAVWRDGFNAYANVEFPENVNNKLLTVRLRDLLVSVKSNYLTRKTALNPSDAPQLSYQPPSEQKLVKREHGAILTALMNVGFDNPDTFYNALLVKTRPKEFILEYTRKFIKQCEAKQRGEPVEDNETVTGFIANKIVVRLEFFKKLRSFNWSKCSSDKQALAKHVIEKGLIDLPAQYGNQADVAVIRELMQVMNGEKSRDGKKERPANNGISSGTPSIPREKPSSTSAPQIALPPKVSKTDAVTDISFPLAIGATLAIIDMGTVVYDRQNFHNDRYVYPHGYTSERLFNSILEPTEKTWYRSMILDQGGEGPVFRVELKGHPEYTFEGPVPSNPWLAVMKAVDDSKRKLHLPCNKSLTVSGPEFFGLSSSIVQQLMSQMENADKCPRFYKYHSPDPSAPSITVRKRRGFDHDTGLSQTRSSQTLRSQLPNRKQEYVTIDLSSVQKSNTPIEDITPTFDSFNADCLWTLARLNGYRDNQGTHPLDYLGEMVAC